MSATTEAVEEVVVETASRVAKGYLNGTTRSQAYGILAATALTGAASGVTGTLLFLKKRYVLQRRFVKIPREVPTDVV